MGNSLAVDLVRQANKKLHRLLKAVFTGIFYGWLCIEPLVEAIHRVGEAPLRKRYLPEAGARVYVLVS